MYNYFRISLILAFFSGMAVFAQVDSQRVLAHFPGTGGGFAGELVLENASNLSKPIVLACYSMDGKHLDDVSIELKPKEMRSVAVEQLLPLGTSHAVISGSDRVSLGVAYQALSSSDSARGTVSEVCSHMGKVRLFPALQEGSQNYWEGAAVVNMGDKPATLIVDMLIDGIKGPPAQAITCNPMEKKIFVFSDLFGEFADIPNFYYQIASEQPFAAVGIAGTKDHRILWPVNPLPDVLYQASEFSNQSIPSLQIDPYEVSELQLNEELLTVNIQYPDHCPAELKLIASGGFMESLPVQVNLTFQRNVDDGVNCIQIAKAGSQTFDLSPLIQAFIDSYGEGQTLQMNFIGFSNEIIAKLNYEPVKP
jgi:hypothetical protein